MAVLCEPIDRQLIHGLPPVCCTESSKIYVWMKDESRYCDSFQHFILSQNFLAELCHERYQDKICEEGRGDETFFNFPRKRSSTSRLEQCDQKAMITRSGQGQRKEDERDIEWIFSFVVSLCIFVIDYINIFAVTVMNELATSLKKIIE